MRFIHFKKVIVAAFIRVACLLFTQIKRGMWGIKALPHICVRALQQPLIQYRMALLLSTILVLLLGWSLFFSTFPHVSFALIGHF